MEGGAVGDGPALRCRGLCTAAPAEGTTRELSGSEVVVHRRVEGHTEAADEQVREWWNEDHLGVAVGGGFTVQRVEPPPSDGREASRCLGASLRRRDHP